MNIFLQDDPTPLAVSDAPQSARLHKPHPRGPAAVEGDFPSEELLCFKIAFDNAREPARFVLVADAGSDVVRLSSL